MQQGLALLMKVWTACVGAATLLCALPASAATEQPVIVQDYEPAPALWKLADEDTTIYLFGTIHVLPEGFRWRNAQFDAVVDEVDELVVESTDDDQGGAMGVAGPKVAAMMEKRAPTSEQLPADVRGKWRKLVEMSGLPFDYTDRVPLMIAMLSFGMGDFDEDAEDDRPLSTYEFGVETVLEEEFRASDRPIGSIESFSGVLLSMVRVDDRLVIGDLAKQLRDWNGKSLQPIMGEDGYEDYGDSLSMEHAWARGEVQDEMELGFGSGKLERAFRRVLLNRRNAAWVDWLDERLERPGKVLVAVGAGHFEGQNSVLELLAKRGFEVERLN